MDEMIKLMIANLPNFLGLVFAIWWMNRQIDWYKSEHERLLKIILDDCADDDTQPSK